MEPLKDCIEDLLYVWHILKKCLPYRATKRYRPNCPFVCSQAIQSLCAFRRAKNHQKQAWGSNLGQKCDFWRFWNFWKFIKKLIFAQFGESLGSLGVRKSQFLRFLKILIFLFFLFFFGFFCFFGFFGWSENFGGRLRRCACGCQYDVRILQDSLDLILMAYIFSPPLALHWNNCEKSYIDWVIHRLLSHL